MEFNVMSSWSDYPSVESFLCTVGTADTAEGFHIQTSFISSSLLTTVYLLTAPYKRMTRVLLIRIAGGDSNKH